VLGRQIKKKKTRTQAQPKNSAQIVQRQKKRSCAALPVVETNAYQVFFVFFLSEIRARARSKARLAKKRVQRKRFAGHRRVGFQVERRRVRKRPREKESDAQDSAVADAGWMSCRKLVVANLTSSLPVLASCALVCRLRSASAARMAVFRSASWRR
jgi:hypothetical protein